MPKLYTKEEALDILLEKYAEANNKMKRLKKEQDEYLDSIPAEEFDRPKDNPVLDKWAKYFSEIQYAKLEKAGVEIALDKVVKLPPFVTLLSMIILHNLYYRNQSKYNCHELVSAS